MLGDIINYLKDPNLVAGIQDFFGIEIPKNTITKNEANILNEATELTTIKRNGSARELHDNSTNQNDILDSFSEEENPIDLPEAVKHDNLYSPIKNFFWYYLFMFGTELGDETFYSAFIPFWFWNIDGVVGRKIVIVWAMIMTIGQILKDIICWPRPACPPAVRLQKKWSQEYGMPSTHAMIGVAIPFSVVLFTMNRYMYSIAAGCTIAVIWCILICVSRLYLGMHTLLDVLVGFLLAIGLMVPLVPFVNFADYYFVTNGWALGIMIAITIIAIVYYPKSDRWTPTRGDTTLVVAVTAGLHLGAWLNYKSGLTRAPLDPPPYELIWPSFQTLGKTILRTILGFCVVLGMKVFCKKLGYAIMCAILRVNAKELMNSENSIENKNKVLVDLVYKYFMAFTIGIVTVYTLPCVFTAVGIERSTFQWEL